MTIEQIMLLEQAIAKIKKAMGINEKL